MLRTSRLSGRKKKNTYGDSQVVEDGDKVLDVVHGE